MPDDEQAKIVGGNTARVYGFDGTNDSANRPAQTQQTLALDFARITRYASLSLSRAVEGSGAPVGLPRIALPRQMTDGAPPGLGRPKPIH